MCSGFHFSDINEKSKFVRVIAKLVLSESAFSSYNPIIKIQEEHKKMEEKKVKDKGAKVGAKRMIAWQSSSMSSGVNGLVLGFVAIYATNTLGMSAALAGMLLMASKLFDGVTDLIAGYIVDRTNTKWGRGRPYELCLIGAWVCTVILYSCPVQLSTVAKSIWLLSMYILVNSVFQTFLKANSLVYMTRAFDRPEHYVALQSYGGIITMLVAVAFNVSFPILMGKLATSAKGWTTLLLIYAVPLGLFGMMRFFVIKETNVSASDVKREEAPKLKDILLVMKNNKYVYIVAAMSFALAFITNLGVNVYYYTYIVKNVSMMSIMAFVQIIALPVVFIYPRFIKKYSTKTLIIVGFIVWAVSYLVNFIAYDNVALLAVGSVLMGIGSVPSSMMAPILLIECADYNEWKGLPRLEGTLSSVRGFAQKVGQGLGTGFTGVMVGMAGYISTTGSETVEQPQSALTMIRMLYSFIPMLLILVVAGIIGLYNLNKLLPQIREDLEKRRNNVAEEA